MKTSKLLLLLPALLLSACLGAGEKGVVAVAAQNAYHSESVKSQAVLPEILQVKKFRIEISGSDFDPIEVFFNADATGGTISGIPVGVNRTVVVEALNSNGQVIRRRKISGVEIAGGSPTSLVASLLSVPIVTNLTDGNLVSQNRLNFEGYAEPGSQVEIVTADSTNSSLVLTDLSTSLEAITPSLSDGFFGLKPVAVPLGTHTFTVRDTKTGEQSQITLTILKPGRQPGVGLSAVGGLGPTFTHHSGVQGQYSEVLDQLSR